MNPTKHLNCARTIWLLSVLFGLSAANNTNDAVATAAASSALQQQQQQNQRRENGMGMMPAPAPIPAPPTMDDTVTPPPPTEPIADPLPPPPATEETPCGCQSTLTRVACSAATMQFETYILARLDSLDLLPPTGGGALDAATVQMLEENLLSAYNEIQNSHHCDRPYHRAMLSAELVSLDDNNGDGSATTTTTSLDQLYLNFKVVIQSHLDSNGNGPAEQIALDANPAMTDNTRRRQMLQRQQPPQQQENAVSSSSLPPPLIRQRRRYLQAVDTGGECTCPTALAGSMDGGFATEAELQFKFNQQLMQLMPPPATDGSSSTRPIIDETLQLSLVEDQGGQCSSSDVFAPQQSVSSFETVLILEVELQPGWQEGTEIPQAELDALVQMQLRLLQDSYNDETFRNCDSHFRRIIRTEPILVEGNYTSSGGGARMRQRKLRRRLQLQQAFAEQLGEVGEMQKTFQMNHSSVYYNEKRNHLSSSEEERQQQRHLFQHIWTSGTDTHNDNMGMLAVRATVECLNDNCPADQKALSGGSSSSSGATMMSTGSSGGRSYTFTTTISSTSGTGTVTSSSNGNTDIPPPMQRQRTRALLDAAAGLRGKNATNTTTTALTSTTRTLHRVVGSTAKDAHHHEEQSQRHLLWPDVMGGCYCPSHIEGTKTAPTSVTLTDAMNKNMDLIAPASPTTSTTVEQVTSISEVEIYDCSSPRTDFTTVISANMFGDPDLVTSAELTALGDGFEETYNSIVFQTCDPFFRTIDAVEVYIPPQEDLVIRRQRLLKAQNNSSSTTSSSTSFHDKDNEKRMLQTTVKKKPFVSAYAVKGKCVGLCPKEDTLFGGGFGTRQRELRAAAVGGSDRVVTEQELRSWIQPDAATSAFSSFQRGLQLQFEQCTCATGSVADNIYSGPTVELMNAAYALKVEELKAQGALVNVDTVEISEEALLCKCSAPVDTSCAIPIVVPDMDGVVVLGYDQYPCDLDCEDFDAIFGIVGSRRQRKLHEIGCDRGVFVCPSEEL